MMPISPFPIWMGIIRVGQVSAYLVVGALVISMAGMAAEPASAGRVLQEKYQAIAERITNSPFHRPIYFESRQRDDRVEGEIYALIDYAYPDVALALSDAGNWCAILMLHPNTKYCEAGPSLSTARITMHIGRKHFQVLSQTSQVNFTFLLDVHHAAYMRVILAAQDGPMGTRDYHILLEAAPLADGRSLLHFSYGYSYGFLGRIAMQSYLNTLGRDKIGFSVAERDEGGRERHVKGIRGVSERNTMRYYLAIESFLDTLDVPIDQRLERRLQDWFAASEVYAEQLHELERAEYMEMKLQEHKRLQNRRR